MKNKLLTVAITLGSLFPALSHAQTTLYGITSANGMFTIGNVSSPSTISGPFTISGVASGQTLVGLDSRPSTGALYALGYDSLTNTAQLYMITGSGSSYTANAVGSALTSVNLGTTNNAAFNFVSTTDNQIRVIGRNGNNYLINASNGSLMSTGTSGLSFAAGDILVGDANALAATAYTNSFYGADATTEVGFDAVNNTLVTFDAGNFSNSFNNASNTLHSVGIGTGLIFTPGSSVAMDMWYDTLTHNNILYMTGSTALGGTHLYTHDMSSALGSLTDMGAIGTGTMTVRAIAFGALRDTTSAIGQLMTGLSFNLRNLVFFDAQNPNNIRRVVSLNGMTAGQSMIGIDYAPSTGILYGLGYNSTAQTYQLYTIDSATGNVTAVNTTAHNLNLGTDNGSGNHVNAGFRFIPTLANTIRVTGNNGSTNVRLDATTGSVTATDTAMTYVTGDANFGTTANLTSIAYTGYTNDGNTQMFGYDANTGALIMFDQNNNSGGTGIGSSGYISTNTSLNTILTLLAHSNVYNNTYISIMYDRSAAANLGYMVANYYGDSSAQQNYSTLYNMTDMLTTYQRGTSTTPMAVGSIGSGTPFKDAVLRRTAYAGPTGVAAVTDNLNDLLIYPNPVPDNARIDLPLPSLGVVSVDIIDLNGNVIRTAQYPLGVYSLDIDMSRLPTGLYSVRVSGVGVGYHNLRVVKE